MSRATIMAVVNQKGGTGKTTTCENLGIGLANEGKRVLLVDTDPQASLTIALGHPRPDDLPVTLTDLMAKVMQDQPIAPKEGIIYKREADVFNPSKQEEYFAWMIDKCDELSNALVQVGEMDEEAQEKDKFTKLKQYLENCGKTELILTFADIEAIIGCTLCKSAYNYSAYWNPSPTHTMPNTILSAGYKIVSVDLISKELVMQKQ